MIDKIDWVKLNTYIENNLITINKHSEHNIWILNYSPKSQVMGLWDDYTISCRGIIIDIDGNILARPLQKFFNINEVDPTEINMSLNYEIFEMIDGSIITLFYYEDAMSWIVASRGSFISEQVIEANKLLSNRVVNSLNKKFTYVLEVIYKENRVIVDYGDRRELILVTAINTKTGSELSHDELINKYSKQFALVKKHFITVSDLNELQKYDEDNRKGFVVKFSNNSRLKIKFNEYMKLDRVINNMSNVIIWEHLKNDYNFDLLINRIPDEKFKWLKEISTSIINDFNNIERLALKEFIRIYHINDISNRKDFTNEAIKTEFRQILFNLYNRKSYDYIVWDLIKPKITINFNEIK